MTEDRVNADFRQRVVIATEALPWKPSPQKGVERRLLDRIGGEIARATSLVRYAPASHFPAHAHALGEEFLVLDGVFSDEQGDYPAGTYVRNPPGSSHAPYTGPGCTILVKLRQMPPAEKDHVVVDTTTAVWRDQDETLACLPLHTSPYETVALERLAAGTQQPEQTQESGEEIFVLSGELVDGEGTYPVATWIRNPAGHRRALMSQRGTTYWVKRGHLRPAT
jgi:anti-sigma factor ChrR (cupin superfamily)